MVTLIGISGKKGSGKDAITSYLMSRFSPKKCIRIAFADALKEEVAKACGVTVKFIEDNKDLFRPILQWWGTEFRRKLNGDDYWINQWLKKVRDVDAEYIFTPDVRFLNEAKIVKEAGGHLWRVDRCEFEHGIRFEKVHTDTHPSEIELDDFTGFDLEIRNHGTLQQLHEEVDLTLTMRKIT